MDAILITGHDPKTVRLTDAMFKLRARVFHDELKWQVEVDDKGWERDRLDDQNPVYILAVENGILAGSARLLPTSGPVLNDSQPFSQVFANAAFEHPGIWECSRLCVEPRMSKRDKLFTMGFLTRAIGQFAMDSNYITSVIGHFEDKVLDIYNSYGCQIEILEVSTAFNARVSAGLFPITEDHLASIDAKVSRHASMRKPLRPFPGQDIF